MSFLSKIFGGGNKVQTPKQSIQQLWDLYTKNLPKIEQSTAGTTGDLAAQQLAATQATAPGYGNLNLQQLQALGLPLAEIGQDIQRSNALAGAETNLQQIQGAGGQAATAGKALTDQLTPTLPAAEKASTDLLNAINLKGLSPGEEAAVERSTNQTNTGTGNLGLLNPTNTISNAINFGGAFNSKIPLAEQAIGTANTTTGTSLSAMNPVQTALGQPALQTQSNFGTGTFQPITSSQNAGTSQQALGFGESLLGAGSSQANSANQAQASLAQAYTPTAYMQASGSFLKDIAGGGGVLASGGACCFIFLETYNGQLPWFVRALRDYYYEHNPHTAKGYKQMAKWLVPLMRGNKLVAWLVNRYMVQPITEYGGWLMGLPEYSHCFGRRKYKQFWFGIWNLLGV